jgi:hypothetical protein
MFGSNSSLYCPVSLTFHWVVSTLSRSLTTSISLSPRLTTPNRAATVSGYYYRIKFHFIAISSNVMIPRYL